MGNQIGTCHADRQLTVLLQRQKEFKEAALNSKKKGILFYTMEMYFFLK